MFTFTSSVISYPTYSQMRKNNCTKRYNKGHKKYIFPFFFIQLTRDDNFPQKNKNRKSRKQNTKNSHKTVSSISAKTGSLTPLSAKH